MSNDLSADPFSGKAALLFGGAKGIGRAVALDWARRGAKVVVADIDEAGAQETAAAICSEGGQGLGVRADVLSDASTASAIGAAETRVGEIDILMANVGAMLNGHPEDIPFAEWTRIMDLNYLGAVRAISQILPKMLSRGRGHIVTTASFAGLYPYAASRIPYAASKAAIISLTQNLALYAEPLGVRASCFIPGPVATNIMASMTSWTEDCPMRTPGPGLALKTVEEAATTLADGMRAGAILIPTHDKAWDTIRKWAHSPDDFVRAKIAEFEASQVPRDEVGDSANEETASPKRSFLDRVLRRAESLGEGPFSTEANTIGQLLSDPRTRAIVDKHLPGLTSDVRIGMAKGVTLRAAQKFAPEMFAHAKLAAIDADLLVLPNDR